MDSFSTIEVLLFLFLLFMLSGSFSGSETGILAINRYRVRHLAKHGHGGAQRVQKLLDQPDRLIGLIITGNTVVNILASAVATVLSVRIFGEEWGIVIATIALTLIMLIFCEVGPKTLAALKPERVAFPAAYVLTPLLKVTYPVVAAINWLANSVLRVFGVNTKETGGHVLSSEELRTVVNEAGALLPKRHQSMLLSILDLEKVTVEDIMVPRNDIVGLDLNLPENELMPALLNCQHTRLLAWRDDINNVVGFLHARDTLPLLADEDFAIEQLQAILREPYFIPEGTTLTQQLLNFQRNRRRIGLVVDEYGEVQGLVTLEDILEEIVGEYTTDIAAQVNRDVTPLDDGHFLVDGAANLRDLTRSTQWLLPTDGPKTLNGLILEYLETLPTGGTCIRLHGYPMEILQVKDNMVKAVKVMPDLYSPTELSKTP
ncbi:HlyC/CorC family transporter [Permianibacter aggregans]|uniref:Mg2+/Co2+ transporter CorB n=1 Tax=Permianibacter aggregans TaxID=1510150 RepID=A0A4R6UVY2_9GAMM|nr:HlyC/CorC family transporter [Permianibacter aggregans]QGX38638.1 HlyC/CorC family transporter [Permianibacter aggregans]TDQ50426.1 Mg2+/Co2+ transporter CorB [Permianibacter aggregans]